MYIFFRIWFAEPTTGDFDNLIWKWFFLDQNYYYYEHNIPFQNLGSTTLVTWIIQFCVLSQHFTNMHYQHYQHFFRKNACIFKSSMELKCAIEVLLGKAFFMLWIKIIFWSITQEPLGLFMLLLIYEFLAIDILLEDA